MHGPWRRRALVIGALLAVLVAIGAYNLGLAHGVAQQAAQGAAGVAPGYGHYPGHHHGGFGWLFFPLVFFGWFFILRMLCWGGRHRGGHGHHCDRDGVPPAFEEWHRRAHAKDPVDPAAPAPATPSGTPA